MSNLLKKMTKTQLDNERKKQMVNENINEEDRQKRIDVINAISLITNKKER